MSGGPRPALALGLEDGPRGHSLPRDRIGATRAVGRLDIATYRARALAASGQGERATEELRQVCKELEAPEWLFFLRLFIVHVQVGAYEKGRTEFPPGIKLV